jgi:CheY-like chemotaxis protein/predicted regulator of Ras-like GTPase activity (Roadblock/LC7/MglB family)
MKAGSEPEAILIVEDEHPVADALCKVLRMSQNGGYQVASCESGEAALAALQAAYYDLMITDLRMPGLNGIELIERTRQISPSTRSVLITAFGTAEIEARARNLANAYLPKPFSLQDFLQSVKAALAAPAVPLRPVMMFSEGGLREMQQRLEQLLLDTDAVSAALPDWSGQLLVECSWRDESHLDALLALLGNSMAAAAEVARLLGEEDGFELHYHPGKHLEVYSAMVNDTVFLALLFDRRLAGSRMGLVSLYMRRAVEELRGLLNTALVEPGEALGLQLGFGSEMGSALDEAFSFEASQAA